MYVAERQARALALELGWEIDEDADDMICIDLMAADGEEVEECIHVWKEDPEGGEMTVGELSHMRKTEWEAALKELQDWKQHNVTQAPTTRPCLACGNPAGPTAELTCDECYTKRLRGELS